MTGYRFTPRMQELIPLLESDPGLFASLQEDRERGLETYLDYGDEPAENVDWISNGTQPSVGTNGYIFATKVIKGRECSWQGIIQAGNASVGAGTGTYWITLPAPVRLYTKTGTVLDDIPRQVGSGLLYDSSAGQGYFCTMETYAPTDGNDRCRLNIATAPNVTWAATIPFTWANNDFFRWTGTYTLEDLT